MTNPGFLKKNGWRQIAHGKGEYRNINYWDHPNHQPDRSGAFTTTDAARHQKEFANGGCDCIKGEEHHDKPEF